MDTYRAACIICNGMCLVQGEVASKKDLLKAFETDNQEEIVKRILKQGQLQVSDLERKAELERSDSNMLAQNPTNLTLFVQYIP